MSMNLAADSLFVPVGQAGDELHLKHLYDEPGGEPVLLVPGSVENGRIFYSRSLKGLAPYLAQAGYDVYVLDLRGRGQSRPHLGRGSQYGQLEAITEDLPAAMQHVWQQSDQQRIHAMGHSWGGVLFTCMLARQPQWRNRVASLTYWGSKRRATVQTAEARLKIRLFWEALCYGLTALYGYLPARAWRIGADDETRRSHAASATWTRPDAAFLDPDDGFDYARALATFSLPPGLYLTGDGDLALGHRTDVEHFRQESLHRNSRLHRLGCARGHRHDYGHIDMLTHPDAVTDHFPLVLEFLRASVASA